MFRGSLEPRDALVLAGQLGSEPQSRYRAAVLGDPAFLGFGRTEAILSDLFDALVDNSVVTVKAAGGKARQPEPYPRPVDAASREHVIEAPSIDDFPIHLVVGLTRS